MMYKRHIGDNFPTFGIPEEELLNAEDVEAKAGSLLIFNPIGAHSTAEIGELPIGVPQNLVPYITQTAIGLREQLSVFGGDYPTRDGTCIRDYIHVVDVAKAHVVALKRLIKNKNVSNYEVFNLGTGTGSSVLEVINSFENVSGKKLNYKIVDRREGDVIAAYAETSKANEVLGWKTELTLDDAMDSAWKWEQKIRNKQTYEDFTENYSVFPHGENAKEFIYMVEACWSPMFSIQSTTITNAKLLGM